MRWQVLQAAFDKRPRLPARTDPVPRTEIQLGGFGGHGIISAGKIVGQAAAIYEGLEASFTQSYGPEARGGAAGAQVVISTDPIHHPHLIEPAHGIIMSQGAYEKYIPAMGAGSLLLIDDSLITLPDNHRQDITTLKLAATRIAEDLGNNRAANSVMLGFWAGVSGIVSRAALRQSLNDSVPHKTVDINLKGFDIGYEKGLQGLEHNDRG